MNSDKDPEKKNRSPDRGVAGDEAPVARRKFIKDACKAAASIGALLTSGTALLGARTTAEAAAEPEPPAIPGYDWNEHDWGYGIDATRCIGCLRCVEACKAENGVVPTAHHFRTWVERYVWLEGEDRPRVDSHSDPANIAAAGSEREYRFDNRYRDQKVYKAFFVPKICNHCRHPSCVQVCPTGATFKTEDGAVLIDHSYCIGCQYCVQACPYGARFFNYEQQVTDKCTWCYHRITKGLKPACVEVCPVNARIFGDLNNEASDISKFVRDNRVQVLKPETGNAPTCFYVGLDKEVS